MNNENRDDQAPGGDSAEGDRGNVGQEPQGEDFASESKPERSDQLPEEQPDSVAADDKQ